MTPLEDVCISINSGGTPSRQQASYWDGGTIPWIKTGELNDWKVKSIGEKITEEGLKNSSAKIYKPGTVLIAMYGDGKTITTMGIVDKPSATNQACCALVADPQICDPLYLFYALKDRRSGLLNLVVAGAQRNLSVGTIRKFPIPMHPLETQRRIAGILGAYDDLIEVNRRRLEVLEAMARGLFTEWFIRLRFPGHENAVIEDAPEGRLPEGWSWEPFSGLADFVNGFAFKPSHFEGKGLPIVKIPELKNGVSANTPRNSGEEIPERWHIKDGDLLFSWSGTLAISEWACGNALLNQHLFLVTPKREYGRGFIKEALISALPKFGSQGVGATMKHIRRSALDQTMVAIPNDHSIIDRANRLLDAQYAQLVAIRQLNQNLATARDLLLPRLISGQLSVTQAERELEAA